MDFGHLTGGRIEVSEALSAPLSERGLTLHQADVYFRTFQSGDETAFREINESWIAKFFALEERDRQILNNPSKYILAPGGDILMAVAGDTVIGCCALLPLEDGSFEVSKMGLSEEYRGQGIGRRLLASVIEHARALGIRRLYLETNKKLVNAIHLYEALGFHYLPPERIHASPYARANVYMEMLLQ